MNKLKNIFLMALSSLIMFACESGLQQNTPQFNKNAKNGVNRAPAEFSNGDPYFSDVYNMLNNMGTDIRTVQNTYSTLLNMKTEITFIIQQLKTDSTFLQTRNIIAFDNIGNYIQSVRAFSNTATLYAPQFTDKKQRYEAVEPNPLHLVYTMFAEWTYRQPQTTDFQREQMQLIINADMNRQNANIEYLFYNFMLQNKIIELQNWRNKLNYTSYLLNAVLNYSYEVMDYNNETNSQNAPVNTIDITQFMNEKDINR